MAKKSRGAKAQSSDPGKNSDLLIDFAIVTAIEIEKDAVCKAFKLTYKHRVQKGSRVYWRGRLALKGGDHYEIVVAQPPDMAQVDAAILTNDLIHHWDPTALLMVGIAGAASDGSQDDDEALGDLVVGRDVYYYERGKMTEGGKRQEPVTYRADATLLNRFMNLPPLRSRIPVSRPDGQLKPPRMIPAAIASGDKVIADAAIRDQIVNHHRKTRAIEMEGYGFSAAVWQSFEQRRHLVMKAICDRADRNKGEDWQRYAAAVAAQYARHFLRDRPLDPRNKKTEYAIEPLPLLAEQAKSFTEGVNGVSLEMILIPCGKFKMGSPEGKGSDWEWPEHEVTVDDFYIGKYPITQAQWVAVMGGNPSHFNGNKDLPVENVSWSEAKKFCTNLSLMTGREIRLPSEAEWEYACRAGTSGDHAGNLDEMAWYRENSGEETHPVGEKQPNAYGVYDMHGNVWEWCEDVWHSNYKECPSDSEAWWSGGDSGQRVKRGGCWADYETSCRSANRSHGGVHERGHYCGFRVACALKTHAKQVVSSDTIFTGPVTINLSPPSSQQVEKRGQETVRPGERRAFNLPYLRNEYFTGREDVLQALEDGFKGGRLVQAISGMGGIGKTQTAQEYAYRHRGSYKTILWSKATTREMLTADFAAMAELLDLPEKNAGNQGETVKAVGKWLDNNDGWLLILDNADDLAVVREFIPVGGKGHILLTTRAHATGAIATRHSLEKMSLQEGALFLLRRSKKIAADTLVDGAPADLRSQAENLANEMDGLPLALDQAAAYIEEKPTTIARYTELYRSMGAKLRARRGDLPADHPESVSVTFSLAYQKVAGDSTAAADLLRSCAFLEADAIPEEIFSDGASELGEALAAAAALPDGVIDAIGEAGRFSLLRYDPESRTVSIHRLVQDVLKDDMNDNLKRVYVERVVRAVNKVFPTSEYLNWQLCSRLTPHARCLAEPIDELCFEFPEAARMLNQAGEYLNERAQYADAEPLIRRALAIREKAFGIEHASVASSLNNLAGLHYNLGKYAEAESIWKRALAIMEKTGGDESFSFGTGLNNFAELCKKQGKYVEAEPLYQRALEIYKKVSGDENPNIALVLNNLAELYLYQGRYTEAEPLFKRALDIRTKMLGEDHPRTSDSLNDLAVLCYKQGRYEEAEPLLMRVLVIREKALGAEHPVVAIGINNLAELNRKLGRYMEAEPLYQKALAINEKTLGPNHPEVATVLNNLALLYSRQGKYEEAEQFHRRAIEIRGKVLGTEHPEVADSLENLAAVYFNEGKYAEAEPLLKRALTMREKGLSTDHPDIVLSLENYATLLREMNRTDEAARLETRAEEIRAKAN